MITHGVKCEASRQECAVEAIASAPIFGFLHGAAAAERAYPTAPRSPDLNIL
jgi:hypothetical protein